MPIAHVPATQALETSGNISRSVWGGLLRAHNLLVGLIMLCYVALGVEYSVVVPLWENPDEPEHMLYVRYVATHQSPPAAELEGQFTSNDEGGQAPLYYALAAMLVSRIDMSDLDRMHINPYRTWPGHPASHAMFEHTQDEVGPWREVVLAAHIVRLLSVALGAVAVLGVYLVGRITFPRDRQLALMAMALAGLGPGFVASTFGVNNDSAVAAASAIVMILTARALTRGLTGAAALGLGATFGLALLAKANALLLAPLAIIISFRPATVTAARRSSTLKMAIGCLLVSGWWYAWNWWQFGTPIRKEAGRMFAVDGSWRQGLSLDNLRAIAVDIFQSYWGFVGWTDIRMDDWIYLTLAVVSIGALVGLVMLWRKEHWWPPSRSKAPQLMLVAAVVVFGGAVVYRSIVTPLPGMANARFLLPVWSASCILLAAGLLQVVRALRVPALAVAIVLALGLLTAVAPFRYIMPAYPAPLPVWRGDRPTSTGNSLSIDFGKDISLIGYSVPSTAQPGGTLEIKLYWRSNHQPNASYTAFVHLLNADGAKATQIDAVAGGAYPSDKWSAGEVIVEERALTVPEGAVSGDYHLGIGLYSWPSMARLPASETGKALANDMAVVGRITIER